MNSRYRFAQVLKSIVFGTLLSSTGFSDEFAVQDGNQDGVLSGKEIAGLKILDMDGDGELQRSEFVAAVQSQKKRTSTMLKILFAERDTNEDERLSGKEKTGLEKFDSDSDGRITQAELMAGLTSADPDLQGKSFKEIGKIAEERFAELDSTEDGRLTGNEASGAKHFDQNGDGKILLEEFAVGLLLSVSEEEGDAEKPIAPQGSVDTILADVVAAMNDSTKTENVYDQMHEKMQEITDLFFLKYIFKHASNSHTSFQLVKANTKQSKLENGTVEAITKLKCGKGNLKLSVILLKSQIIGLALESPEIDEIDRAFFKDLQDEELQLEFCSAYQPKIKQALEYILDSEDDQAIQFIHPSVIEQISDKPFKKLFATLRSYIKKIETFELETFSSNEGNKGLYTHTVTFLVSDGNNTIRFSGDLQRVGLQNVLTGYQVEKVLDLSPPPPAPTPAPAPAPVSPPTPTPAPAPVMDDDDALPPPPAPPAPITDDGWQKTVAIRDEVQFEMPGESKRTEAERSGMNVIIYKLTVPKMGMTFVMEINPLESDFTSEHEVFFDTYRDALINDSGRELLKEDREPTQNFPNQLLLLKNPDGNFMAIRSIIAGKSIYRGYWLGKSIDEETRIPAKRFLESIVMIDAGGAPRSGSLQELTAPPPAPTTAPAPVVDPIPNE